MHDAVPHYFDGHDDETLLAKKLALTFFLVLFFFVERILQRPPITKYVREQSKETERNRIKT
jgi:hypothetical protein